MDVAVAVAEAAGDELLRIRRLSLDPPDLKEAGDAGAQRVIARMLGELRPDDAVLSEEAADDPSRLQADRVWIIDPLDGTTQFGEKPRHDWAVHVALWERGCPLPGSLRLGVVSLPQRELLHRSDDARLIGTGSRHRIAVSRNRAPRYLEVIADYLGGSLVRMGSAGVKGTTMLRDEADAYIHSGGQYEWDNAAPVAVAAGAGLHVSRIDGSELVYNRPNSRMPDVLICHKQRREEILSALRDFAPEAVAAVSTT